MIFGAQNAGLAARWALIAAAIFALTFLLWSLRDVVVLTFGGVVIAALFASAAQPFSKVMPWGWSVAVAALLILAVIVLLGWLVGAQVASQVQDALQRLPKSLEALRRDFPNLPLGPLQPEALTGQLGGVLGRLGSTLAMLGGAVLDFLLIVFVGLWFALKPGLYRNGFLKLLPKRAREETGRALDLSGRALRRWLLGQLISMAVVGLLVGLGTWWIGTPAPLALGLFAGVAEFVPLVGPFVSGAVAVLVALTVDTTTALWTLALFLVVQQIESNVILPLVQRRMVELPPALTILAVVAFGLIFGPLGVIFATPLLVVVFVLTKVLWVQDALDTPTDVPSGGASR